MVFERERERDPINASSNGFTGTIASADLLSRWRQTRGRHLVTSSFCMGGWSTTFHHMEHSVSWTAQATLQWMLFYKVVTLLTIVLGHSIHGGIKIAAVL